MYTVTYLISIRLIICWRLSRAQDEVDDTPVSAQQFQEFMKFTERNQKMHFRISKNASPATPVSAAEIESTLTSMMAVRLAGLRGIC
jgi:hypothetical protein